jgi:gamma-glutamyltranspeptidase/glutathione hydrolase
MDPTMNAMSFEQPYPSQRSPVLAQNVVATSQPLAAQAGLRMLLAGGNAVDAALAAAMALVVVEPTGNGLGSDAFAIVWDGTELHGLNASGRAPAAWTPDRFAKYEQMPLRGWDSATVPGAVSAWVALSDRFGKLSFAELLAPAISYAETGFPVSPVIAGQWARIAGNYAGQPGFDETFLPGGRVPTAGERFVNRDLAAGLRDIAETKGESVYTGAFAEALCRHAAKHGGALTMADLAAHETSWCGTIARGFGDWSVHELPPNTQGIATLMALGILGQLEMEQHAPDSADALHLQIEAMKLAFTDLAAHVGDPGDMPVDAAALLDDDYLPARAALIDPKRAGAFGAGAPLAGGTVYVATADAAGMMVSYIQSNYQGFGSGVVVPGIGASLNNRGAGFSLAPGHPNVVAPGKRPLNTIIPGFMMRRGEPFMSFGVMGGPMQAQGHLQMALRVALWGQNPQAASDAPRWRVIAGKQVAIEAGMDERLIAELAARGHEIVREAPDASWAFGGAQLVSRTASGYVAGSDHRKDGCAVGY